MSQVAGWSAAALWRFRRILVAVVLVMTGIALQPLAGLRVSNTLSAWYPDDDPEIVHYRQFQSTYGSDEIIVVAVRGADRFDSDSGLQTVGELTDRLLDIDGVASVNSLVTVPQSMASARARLLGRDGRTTALLVQIVAGSAAEAERARILDDIRAAVAGAGLAAALGGYGVVFEALNQASTDGAATLVAAAHLVMILVLAAFLRNARAVLLTVGAVGIGVTWTMGLFAWTGHRLNMVTMVLPTLVIVIGTANCLHVLRAVAAQPAGQDRGTRVTAGLAAVIGPCFLMTLTTAAGFLGLTYAGLPVIRELGGFGAAGVLAAFISAMALLPAGLARPGTAPDRRDGRIDRLALRLFAAGKRYPHAVTAAFALLGLVSLYGIGQLRSDTDSMGYMNSAHTVRKDSDFIEKEIGSYMAVEFVVTASADPFEPAFLDSLQAWQRSALSIPGVDWSWSLLDVLGIDTNEQPSDVGIDVLEARLSRARRFSRRTVAAMWNGDAEFRVTFGVPVLSARGIDDLIRRLEGEAAVLDRATVRPAGYSPLYTRIVSRIVDSQQRGFVAALLMVVVLVGLAMRSWQRMLLALAANTLPVMMTLGLMGLCGIPLDVASATIASVILGLVVDDTVHLLHPGREHGVLRSLESAARRAGGTLVMTSVVLAAGFLVLGLAELRSIAWFGVLTGFAVLIAIVTDLTLLPAATRLCQLHTGKRGLVSH